MALNAAIAFVPERKAASAARLRWAQGDETPQVEAVASEETLSPAELELQNSLKAARKHYDVGRVLEPDNPVAALAEYDSAEQFERRSHRLQHNVEAFEPSLQLVFWRAHAMMTLSDDDRRRAVSLFQSVIDRTAAAAIAAAKDHHNVATTRNKPTDFTADCYYCMGEIYEALADGPATSDALALRYRALALGKFNKSLTLNLDQRTHIKVWFHHAKHDEWSEAVNVCNECLLSHTKCLSLPQTYYRRMTAHMNLKAYKSALCDGLYAIIRHKANMTSKLELPKVDKDTVDKTVKQCAKLLGLSNPPQQKIPLINWMRLYATDLQLDLEEILAVTNGKTRGRHNGKSIVTTVAAAVTAAVSSSSIPSSAASSSVVIKPRMPLASSAPPQSLRASSLRPNTPKSSRRESDAFASSSEVDDGDTELARSVKRPRLDVGGAENGDADTMTDAESGDDGGSAYDMMEYFDDENDTARWAVSQDEPGAPPSVPVGTTPATTAPSSQLIQRSLISLERTNHNQMQRVTLARDTSSLLSPSDRCDSVNETERLRRENQRLRSELQASETERTRLARIVQLLTQTSPPIVRTGEADPHTT